MLSSASTDEAVRACCRQLCLVDLFFLLVYGLNRKDIDVPGPRAPDEESGIERLQRDWLYDRCREVQAAPDGYMDLWAREHYKSSLITFGLTIQNVLADPELTVGIFSFTRPIAKQFLRQIKQEFEQNVRLKLWFRDVLWTNPHKEAPKWSEDDGIILKRTGNPKEATVEAWGMIDSMPTSKHFKVMVYDDVVTDKSVTTPDMILKVTDKWALSLSLGAEGGVSRYVGTFYHYNDTYNTIRQRTAAIPRIKPATHDGSLEGRPVFLSMQTLARKRKDMGPYIFSCQMLLDPKADDTQGFKESWLEYWPAKHYRGLNHVILIDPASEKKADSDYTCAWVLGLGADKNYYVIDIIRDRLNLVERANLLFALHRAHKPMYVYYEKYGMQCDIEHYQDRMDRENYRFKIKPLGGARAKPDRIKSLVPLFEDGRIFLPETCIHVNHEGIREDLTKVFVQDEYKAFPFCAHDDMLDALARINDPDFNAAFPDHVDGPYGRAIRSEVVDDLDEDRNNYNPLRDFRIRIGA